MIEGEWDVRAREGKEKDRARRSSAKDEIEGRGEQSKGKEEEDVSKENKKTLKLLRILSVGGKRRFYAIGKGKPGKKKINRIGKR